MHLEGQFVSFAPTKGGFNSLIRKSVVKPLKYPLYLAESPGCKWCQRLQMGNSMKKEMQIQPRRRQNILLDTVNGLRRFKSLTIRVNFILRIKEQMVFLTFLVKE
jgi:hypothetical protein